MSIPNQYKHRSLYHFTHIENLPGILEHNILSTNMRQHFGIPHRNIANEEIQERRSMMNVICGCGGVVHDYVPFYFCKRSPMLYFINKNIIDQSQIIYLEFPIQILERYRSVFTDASANTNYLPNFYDDTSCLVNLDWEAIDTHDWGQQYDPTKGIIQRKQAEALIYKTISLESLKKVVVYDVYSKRDVQKIFSECCVENPMIDWGIYGYYF